MYVQGPWKNWLEALVRELYESKQYADLPSIKLSFEICERAFTEIHVGREAWPEICVRAALGHIMKLENTEPMHDLVAMFKEAKMMFWREMTQVNVAVVDGTLRTFDPNAFFIALHEAEKPDDVKWLSSVAKNGDYSAVSICTHEAHKSELRVQLWGSCISPASISSGVSILENELPVADIGFSSLVHRPSWRMAMKDKVAEPEQIIATASEIAALRKIVCQSFQHFCAPTY